MMAGFSTMASLAASRVRQLMKQTDMERPADLIADIMHYCRAEGIEFDAEVNVAELYVSEEEGYDDAN
jgi:Tfp pilus assembly protein FimT